MGIPSYYKKLKDSVKGLIFKEKTTTTQGLYFDFNCLVYHVLHTDSVKPYPGEDGRIQWENHLIEEVVKYVLKIVGLIQPTQEVFIAVDGVVPFAKMKQQRLRRFKSAAMAVSSTEDKWDRNSITPGTYFMERLGARLIKLGKDNTKNGVNWLVQDASVPGEGEQKIMAYLRAKSVDALQDIVIYGLDADLIVLSLLLRQELEPTANVALFRENIERGEMVRDGLGNETYVFLNINLLENYILTQLGYGNGEGGARATILNYTMAMSFLGNDFLPHGLSQKMSEEGHQVLIEILTEMFREKKTIIDISEEGCPSWNKDGIVYMFGAFGSTEPNDIFRNLKKKLLSNAPVEPDSNPDFYPAEKVEYVVFDDFTRETKYLKRGWSKIYYEHWLGGYEGPTAKAAALHYFEGMQWILNYYMGRPVSNSWYYPFTLPPLWRDLSLYINGDHFEKADGWKAESEELVEPIKPQEQLAMVLPFDSWWLIRDKRLKTIPYSAPQYWPIHHKVFSVGKKWMWECEAQIPLLVIKTLRAIGR